VNDRCGNSSPTGSFEVKIRTDRAKCVDMRIARFGYLVRENEVFVEDYADIASGLGGFDRAVVKFGYLLLKSNEEKFGF